MIVSSESENIMSIDVEETQKEALAEFFNEPITKTMCAVKKTDYDFNGAFQVKLINQYTFKQIEEMKTIFWIGYNTARIENGQ
jgi:hypothetical protein